VENDNDLLFRGNPLAIDTDVVGFADAGSELDAGFAVDLNPAGCDQLITGTP
jgi:hypothetical protein